jgi:hypothetical protein
MNLTPEIIVGLLSCGGTIIGTFGGIMAANRLTNYRIEQLEKKVDKHNNFAGRIPVIEEQMKVANHRIDDLEQVIREK